MIYKPIPEGYRHYTSYINYIEDISKTVRVVQVNHETLPREY